jgi:hypothetical protein
MPLAFAFMSYCKHLVYVLCAPAVRAFARFPALPALCRCACGKRARARVRPCIRRNARRYKLLYWSNLLLSASPVVLNSVALASFRHLHGAPGRAGHLDHQLAGKGREKKTE